MIVYLTVKLITTFGSVPDATRQGSMATAMVVCVYGIIIVSIIFALYTLVVLLVQSVMKLAKKMRKMKAVANAPKAKILAKSKKN